MPPLTTGDYTTVIMTSITVPVSIIACSILLLLTITDRLLTSNTAKLLCAYFVATIIFQIIDAPYELSSIVQRTVPNVQSLCQFVVFIRTFYESSKGLFVLVITIMPFMDALLRSRNTNHSITKHLPTIATLVIIMLISTTLGGVSAAFHRIMFTEYNNQAYCIHDFPGRVVSIILYSVCGFLTCLAAIVTLVVLVIQRHRYIITCLVECIVVVLSYTCLWIPRDCFMLALTLNAPIYIQPVAYITSIMSFCELAVMPVLLLALPTAYNQALLRRIAQIPLEPIRGQLCCRQATTNFDTQEMANTDAEGMKLPD